MDYDTLQEYKWSRPFRPFRLVVRDGRAFDIRDPNQVWPGRVTTLVGVPVDPARPQECGTWVSVPLTDITGAELLDPPAGP